MTLRFSTVAKDPVIFSHWFVEYTNYTVCNLDATVEYTFRRRWAKLSSSNVGWKRILRVSISWNASRRRLRSGDSRKGNKKTRISETVWREGDRSELLPVFFVLCPIFFANWLRSTSLESFSKALCLRRLIFQCCRLSHHFYCTVFDINVVSSLNAFPQENITQLRLTRFKVEDAAYLERVNNVNCSQTASSQVSLSSIHFFIWPKLLGILYILHKIKAAKTLEKTTEDTVKKWSSAKVARLQGA